jgi:citrate lyase subunit beta/citryl-CoA lyase
MRSKLFVPASRPDLFAKALAGAADAVSFDLEDAVLPAQRAAARAALLDFLHTVPPGHGKVLIVRVNAPGSADFDADAAAATHPAVHMVNLPKVERPGQVHAAVRTLQDAQAAHGRVQPLSLLLNIETPAALRRAHELAAAHPRVAGLQLGLADQFEPCGIDRHESAAVLHAMLAVRLAAAEAGRWACDAAFADIADAPAFEAEARLARRLGYMGKSCIHPSQVPLANAAFSPSAQEIAQARRVVDAAHQAAQRGPGALQVDGRMVDAPFIARAEALLAQARRWGLAPADAA